MNKFFLIIISFTLMAFLSCTVDGFKIKIIGWNSVEITEYVGTDNEIEIPSKLRSMSVTSIGSKAFENKQITSVIIPDTVTRIGASAFEGNNLTDVVIPESVTHIGYLAFFRNQLINVTIPYGVVHIGWEAFGSNQLGLVRIPYGVTYMENAFYNNNFFDIGTNYMLRLYPGDSVLINDGSDSHQLTLEKIDDSITINTQNGTVVLDLGQVVTINLTDNDFTSLQITVLDFFRNDSISGALLQFELGSTVEQQSEIGKKPRDNPIIQALKELARKFLEE